MANKIWTTVGVCALGAWTILGECRAMPHMNPETHSGDSSTPALTVRLGDLDVDITEARPAVYRFEVQPATGASRQGAMQMAGQNDSTVRFDAADRSLVITRDGAERWRGRFSTVARYGRAHVPGLEISWRAPRDEAVYGLGERFDSFDQAGKRVEMWVRDVPGQGDGSETYYCTPVLFSSAGYALFAADNPEGHFELNTAGDGKNRYQRAGRTVVFYVAVGDTLSELLQARAAVQGPFRAVPDWSWGPWISRNSYENQAEAEEALEGMLKRGLPVAAMVQEAWKGTSETGDFNNFSADRWPDPQGFIDRCLEHGIYNILWQVPIIHPSSPHYRTGVEKGYFVLQPDGQVSHREHWLAGFAHIDFTNPDAVKFWQDLLRPVVRMGIGGFKTDDGEDIKPDDVFADGRRGWELHNKFSVMYAQAVQELMDEEGVDGMLWGRSASLGIEHYPALWAGDQWASWDQMASLLPAGLSASVSGTPFWGHDIGGYIGNPSPELYIRWTQFGALSPLMQYHGIERREPWYFGELAEAAYRRMAYLRMNLVPALIDLGKQTAETGLPIMRPMMLDFPDDPRFKTEETQYMLGPDMLVAPILEPDVTGRAIHFPAGVWHSADRSASFEGPATYDVPIGLLQIPLFLREGARLPVQLAEDAPLGFWSPEAPERELIIAANRSVLRNPRVPLVGDTVRQEASLRFTADPASADRLDGYWYFEDVPAEARRVVPVWDGDQVVMDFRPSDADRLANRRQTYVVTMKDDDGLTTELFRGAIQWRSPVSVQSDLVVHGTATDTQSVVLRLHNRTDEAIRVTVEARPDEDVSMPLATRAVEIGPRATVESRWEARFALTPRIGDSRIHFKVRHGDHVLDEHAAIFLRPPHWVVAGPFPAPPQRAYATTFAPEWSIEPDTAFRAEHGLIRWEQVAPAHLAAHNGIDFIALFGETEQAATYALTQIDSDREQDVELRFGSDDTLTVWLNGDRIYSVETYRAVAHDQEVVRMRLRRGVNTVLVKVAQDRAGWALYARVTAPGGAPVTGLSDGFSDWAAYAPRRAVRRETPALFQPFDWHVLGPIKTVPVEDEGWALDFDRMAKETRWPPPPPEGMWRSVPKHRAPENHIDFIGLFGQTDYAVVYAATVFEVDRPTPAEFLVGSDDGIIIWLNGEVVHEAHRPRAFQPGEDRIRVTLPPGSNRLLCRISQDEGGWEFQVNVFDLSGAQRRPIMNPVK